MSNKHPQILIVDDEPSICDLLKEDLTDRGYVCTTALHSLGAFTKLAKQRFDVVLLDIMLPGMSGMDVLKEIRTKDPDTEVIMITGVNRTDTMIDALNIGARDFVIKPIDLDELHNTIENILMIKEKLPEKECKKTNKGISQEDEGLVFEESPDEMNLIACRAAVGLDLCVKCSQFLLEKTVSIARKRAIPEREIQRWIAVRERNGSGKKRAVGADAVA